MTMTARKTEGVIDLGVTLRPNAISDGFAIKSCRDRIDLRIRQFGEENAWRWIEIGEELSGLKKFLAKPGPADKVRIGWKEAFRHDPKPCPWNRQNADKLIKVHEFFGGDLLRSPTQKLVYNSLPMSWQSLYFIATTLTHDELVEHVKAKRITPISTEAEVRRLTAKTAPSQTPGSKPNPSKEPKELPIAEVGHRAAQGLIKRYTVAELRSIINELMQYCNEAGQPSSEKQKE